MYVASGLNTLHTVLAYAKAARALDAWMTEKKVDGDFAACDTALLNRFFRDYTGGRRGWPAART